MCAGVILFLRNYTILFRNLSHRVRRFCTIHVTFFFLLNMALHSLGSDVMLCLFYKFTTTGNISKDLAFYTYEGFSLDLISPGLSQRKVLLCYPSYRVMYIVYVWTFGSVCTGECFTTPYLGPCPVKNVRSVFSVFVFKFGKRKANSFLHLGSFGGQQAPSGSRQNMVTSAVSLLITNKVANYGKLGIVY